MVRFCEEWGFSVNLGYWSCLHVLMVVWLWLTIDRWLLMMLVIWGKTPTKIRGNSPQSPQLSARFWMPRNLKPILQYTPCSWEGRCMGSGASSNNLYLISQHNPWTIFVFSCACSTMTFCPKHLAEHDPFLALPNFPTPPNHPPPKKALCLVGLPLYLPCSASRFRFGIGMWRHSGEACWDGLGLGWVGSTRMISAGAMIAMKIPIWDVLRFSILQTDDWKFAAESDLFLCFCHKSRSHGMFVCWTSLDCHPVPENTQLAGFRFTLITGNLFWYKEGLFFREGMAYPGMSHAISGGNFIFRMSGGVIMKGIDGQLAERSRSFQTPLRKVSFRQCRGSLVVIGPTAILSTINVPEVQGTSPRRKIPP